MSKLLILGAAGAAKKALEATALNNPYSKIDLLDNFIGCGAFLNYSIIGKCDDLENFSSTYTHAFVCITDPKTRLYYLRRLKTAGYIIPNIIHELSYVSTSAVLGVGVFVNAFAAIQSDAEVSDGCLINTGAVVEHNNVLAECVNISPNVTTTGSVKIDRLTFVGAGSSVINHIHIGENVMVAAGSVVTADVPDNVMIAGCPAKIKKQVDAIKYKKDQIVFDREL